MAFTAPAQAENIWFWVDDFETCDAPGCAGTQSVEDVTPGLSVPPSGPEESLTTTIDPTNHVWGVLGGGTATREISANLLSGDRVATEICNNCKAAHLVSDSAVPTFSDGEFWFVWKGDAIVDPDRATNDRWFLEFEWSADLAGTTWFADFDDGTGVVNTAVQAALPASPTLIPIQVDIPAGLGDLTQVSLHFNGVPGLDANIDNVMIHHVPEPGSLALIGFGLAGLAGWRRRRAG
jgi:hypothetical protein